MINLPIRDVWRGRLLYALGALLLIVAVGSYISSRAEAKSSDSRSGMHVLTIYDSGQERGILTDADTLREALEDADFKLQENDITEPSLDEELVAATYEINVYRARPVVVYDEGSRTKLMTAHTTPKQIAKQAGITLHEEDQARLEQSTDLLGDGAMEKMVIERATSFNLVLYGKKIPSFTMAETVGEMLIEKGITIESQDTLSVKESVAIKAGMTVEVWRNGKQTITEEEVVKKPIEKIEDADREIGYSRVDTPGKDGKRSVTYEVVMKNGKEISRKEISSIILEKPVKEVVIVGAKPSFTGDFAQALAKLRSCEGGYESWNPAGPYYGAYQFDRGTWGTVADPAKYGNATPAEQDAAAHQLYLRRGWQPWPVCGAPLPDIYR